MVGLVLCTLACTCAVAPPPSLPLHLSNPILRALIHAAIRAHGGRDNLKKRARYYWRAEGTLTFGKATWVSRDECWGHLPDRWRMSHHYRSERGERQDGVVVHNGQKVWISADGQTKEAPKTARATSAFRYYGWLLPLIEDPSLRFAPLPARKVGKRWAAGVRVTSPDRGPASLYFDEETYRLTLLEAPVYPLGGPKILSQLYLSEYKEKDGVLWPMKQRQVGRDFSVDLRLAEVKVLQEIDERLFAKP